MGSIISLDITPIRNVKKLQNLNKFSSLLDDINRAIDIQMIKNSMHAIYNKTMIICYYNNIL